MTYFTYARLNLYLITHVGFENSANIFAFEFTGTNIDGYISLNLCFCTFLR